MRVARPMGQVQNRFGPVVTHVGQVGALKGSADSLEVGSKIKNDVKSGLTQFVRCLIDQTYKREGHGVFW